MEMTHDVLELAYYEANKIKPATLVKRQGGEHWLVRDLPLGVDAKASQTWGLVHDGAEVCIPLFPYLSNGPDPAIALAFAFELGAKARDTLGWHYTVTRAHVSVGHPVQEVDGLTEQGVAVLRFWLGFAFVIREIH